MKGNETVHEVVSSKTAQMVVSLKTFLLHKNGYKMVVIFKFILYLVKFTKFKDFLEEK